MKLLSCSPEEAPQQPGVPHLIADNCPFFVSVLFFLVCGTRTKGMCTLKVAYSIFTLQPVRPCLGLGVCLTNMSNRRADVGWAHCPGTLLIAGPSDPQVPSLKPRDEDILLQS